MHQAMSMRRPWPESSTPILDDRLSIGLNISDGFERVRQTLMEQRPRLVIIDPWQAYLGANVDMNRVNAVRPIFQKITILAKDVGCSIVLVSHVGKKQQADVNNSALGSTDFINASRSVIKIIQDQGAGMKIAVHTKCNYARLGKSVKYCISDSGIQWAGFSDITKDVLESAAMSRVSPHQYLLSQEEHAQYIEELEDAIRQKAEVGSTVNVSYQELKDEFGSDIFGPGQPQKALDQVRLELSIEGIHIENIGKKVKYNGRAMSGFILTREKMPDAEKRENDSHVE